MAASTASTASASSIETGSRRAAAPPNAHPYLTSTRVSTIESWTESLPERVTCQLPLEGRATTRDSAIEAYQKLKIALFSKALMS